MTATPLFIAGYVSGFSTFKCFVLALVPMSFDVYPTTGNKINFFLELGAGLLASLSILLQWYILILVIPVAGPMMPAVLFWSRELI